MDEENSHLVEENRSQHKENGHCLFKKQADSKEYNENENCIEEKPQLRVNSNLHPLDGKWSWLVCFCGVLCNVIVFGYTFNFGLLYPALLKEFGESKASTALVGSLAMCLTFAFAPLAAFLYDRLGSRKAPFLGGLLCAVGLASSSRVGCLPILYFTYSIIFGFGASCTQTTVLLIVPRYFKTKSSLALGIVCMASGLGLLIFGQMIGRSLEALGWRRTYLVMSGIAALIMVLGLTFDGKLEGLRVDETQKNAQQRTSTVVDESYPVIWKNYPFLIFSVLTTAIEFCHAIVFVHLANYTQQMGITADHSDVLYQVLGVSSMLSRVTCGHVLDKCSFVTPQLCYRFSSTAVGLTVILCPFLSTFYALVGFSVAFGIFYGTFELSLYAYFFDIVSLSQRSKAFGVFNLVTSIGYVSGPPFAGFLVDFLHSYPSIFYLTGGVEMVCCLLSFGLRCFKHGVDTASSRRDSTKTFLKR